MTTNQMINDEMIRIGGKANSGRKSIDKSKSNQMDIKQSTQGICLGLDGAGASRRGPETRAPGKKQRRKRATGAAKEKAKFIRAFQDSGFVASAARLSGIERATHSGWLATDEQYKAEFEASRPMAADAVRDQILSLATEGFFQPIIYKGEFQYAKRKRTLCKLKDGTTAFEDELPKHANVIQRRTVTTADGEMLGIYRKNPRLIWAVADSWTKEYEKKRGPKRENYSAPCSIKILDKNGNPVFI